MEETGDTGVLAQSLPGTYEQPKSSGPIPTNTGDGWGQYAASTHMSGFGSLAVSGASQLNNQHNTDGFNQRESKNQGANLFGNPDTAIPTPLPHSVVRTFGQASPPRHGFDKVVCKPPAIIISPPEERSLEDLYKDYPEKRLKDIDEKALDLAAKVILQIANEATFQWINRWCPGMAWLDLIGATKPDAQPIKCRQTYHVPMEATSNGSPISRVIELFHQCHKRRSQCPNMQMKDLIDITCHCALMCQALKDEKRRVLLDKATDEIKWVSIGLGCKKMHVYKQASVRLAKLNKKLGELQNLGLAAGEILSQEDETRRRETEEKKILDRATKSFHEHRNTFRQMLMSRLQVLMSATGTFRGPTDPTYYPRELHH
ncbi:hypothetical protein F4809DRAFT_666106 [Biscogniauxia mediterranea]|nr:hypothetical protein F4809DRAFT_666106 [Biscogniauxia mediterranea]